MSSHEILDTFWTEFNAFQNQTCPYQKQSSWASINIVNGHFYLWHEKYSLSYTSVLGLCGSGPARRSWGGVKQIKDSKRSRISGASTEKRSILFSAKIAQARIEFDRMKKLDATGHTAMFGDNNINFNLQLDKFGVDTEALKVGDVERVFRAWVEDWELGGGRMEEE